MQRLLFVVNDLRYFISHRLPVAEGALQLGYEVHVAAPAGDSRWLTELGFHFHPIRLRRGAPSLLSEFNGIADIWALMRDTSPDIVHLVTSKPVIYGGICARLLGVRAVVAAISGLGYIYTGSGIKVSALRVLVSALYRLALGQPKSRVIFQNEEDRRLFLNLAVVRPEQTRLFRGSGVDLLAFAMVPEPEGVPTVLFPARLLGDKGIREFLAAVELLQQRGMEAHYVVAGDPDSANPTSVGEAELSKWKTATGVNFIGHSKSMAVHLQACNIVCLPSYREGLPKSLVEAASCGRAVVTTDVPGCRDAIIQNETGLLVPARNVPLLAEALAKLIEDRGMRLRLGRNGRALAEREFGIGKIVNQHLDLYASIGGFPRAGETKCEADKPATGGARVSTRHE